MPFLLDAALPHRARAMRERCGDSSLQILMPPSCVKESCAAVPQPTGGSEYDWRFESYYCHVA